MSTKILEKEWALDLQWARAQFPALKKTVNGHAAAFLDGPGGTQVPQQVIDAVVNYLTNSNANTGGAYATSRSNDAMLAAAHAAMADFLGCESQETIFGQNTTTLVLALSRSIGRELKSGDEIVVTTLDHDANVTPWKLLEENGIIIRHADINVEDCTLNLQDLASKINRRTRLVTVGYASNAVGTINNVLAVVRLAHAAGALAFIDAVHYAPHGAIDVRSLDCDFLACSPYKFFGPHCGVLYGKREHLERLRPYKLRAQYEKLPDRWETGTLCHEAIAGVLACIEYLAELGRRATSSGTSRRQALLAAYEAIREYEQGLIPLLISGLLSIPGLKLYGISDPKRFSQRTPTVALRIAGRTPLELAQALGERGIFTWDGHYFALDLARRLDVESSGGFLRIGLVHYNTAEEVARVVDELQSIAKR
jgi:cysteine desulfurase family protein (TIGR01976 family)